jgi:hypothetical protein
MLYCPNCCCYFGNEQPLVCPKCHVDITAAMEDRARREARKRSSFDDWLKDNPGTAQPNPGPVYRPTCPTCSEPMSPFPDEGYSFELLGREIAVQDVKVMSMTIRKRVVTQVVLEFRGWECPAGHRYYTSLRETVRELCPVCHTGMVRFGQTVLTCKSCGVNVTKENFVYEGGRELLAEEGWVEMR